MARTENRSGSTSTLASLAFRPEVEAAPIRSSADRCLSGLQHPLVLRSQYFSTFSNSTPAITFDSLWVYCYYALSY